MTVETHPLEPFIPASSRVLFLGSFPPPRSRWSMDFFYPNWINDFWRIMGLLYLGDKTYFEVKGEKRFDRERIISFCLEKGFAFYDSASKVRRLKDNASDNFLEIVEPADIPSLLERMPACGTIISTGGKSSEELAMNLKSPEIPQIGSFVNLEVGGRDIRWFRVPSSSRAYPMKLEAKAEVYRSVLISALHEIL